METVSNEVTVSTKRVVKVQEKNVNIEYSQKSVDDVLQKPKQVVATVRLEESSTPNAGIPANTSAQSSITLSEGGAWTSTINSKTPISALQQFFGELETILNSIIA